jgi:hypothetical protein
MAYVDKSFQLFSTTAIQYEHDKRHVGEIEGDIWIEDESEDEW